MVLKVSGLSDAALLSAQVPGHFQSALHASWGLQVPLGSVCFGQPRSVVVSVPTAALGDPATAASAASRVRVDVEYLCSNSLDVQACSAEGLAVAAAADGEAVVQALRLRAAAALHAFAKAPRPESLPVQHVVRAEVC